MVSGLYLLVCFISLWFPLCVCGEQLTWQLVMNTGQTGLSFIYVGLAPPRGEDWW